MTPNTTTHTANLGRGEKYQLSLGIQCEQTLLRRRFSAEAIIQRCHQHTKKAGVDILHILVLSTINDVSLSGQKMFKSHFHC